MRNDVSDVKHVSCMSHFMQQQSGLYCLIFYLVCASRLNTFEFVSGRAKLMLFDTLYVGTAVIIVMIIVAMIVIMKRR